MTVPWLRTEVGAWFREELRRALIELVFRDCRLRLETAERVGQEERLKLGVALEGLVEPLRGLGVALKELGV